MTADEPKYVRVRRFCPETEATAAVEHLHKHGFTVFRGLNLQECNAAIDGLWSWLESLGTGLTRSQPETWDDDKWPCCVEGGIMPYHGIGQSEFMWYVRTRPGVLRAFAAVWGVEPDELITSLDGATAFRPWRRRPERRTEGGWYHVDQHPMTHPGFDCVQGLVNIGPATTKATGGNVLVPRSHASFGRFARDYPSEIAALDPGDDFFPLPKRDPLLTVADAAREDGAAKEGDAAREHGAAKEGAAEESDADAAPPPGPIVCLLERGDVLLWESRTVHCSTPGDEVAAAAAAAEEEDDEDDEAALLRAAAFVCQVPRSRASPAVLERRKQAVRRRETTAHRPFLFQPTHEYDAYKSVRAEVRARYCVAADEPVLSRVAARLVGYTGAEVDEGCHLPGRGGGRDADP